MTFSKWVGESNKKWHFSLKDNDVAYVIPGTATPHLLCKGPATVDLIATTFDGPGGIVEYATTANDLVAGDYKGQIKIIDGSSILISEAFDVKVKALLGA